MEMFLVLCVLVAIVVLQLLVQSYRSRRKTDVDFFENRLCPCANKPNCVCSEYNNQSKNHVEAIMVDGDSVEMAWDYLIETIVGQGGHIQKNNNGYLWAIFTSKFWKFIDDFEARLDHSGRAIHIRSASRVGYSDFGVNRKRVETIRAAHKAMNATN